MAPASGAAMSRRLESSLHGDWSSYVAATYWLRCAVKKTTLIATEYHKNIHSK
jgi:hypothetical protein